MQFQTHIYPLLIMEHHLDTFGHVNNSTYLEILEEARWDLITSNGFGLTKIQSDGLGPVILEIHMKFKKEITLREKVTIETKCLAYERKIGKLEQIIKNEKGEVCFWAELAFGLFDTQTRKLVVPTQGWMKAVGKVGA